MRSLGNWWQHFTRLLSPPQTICLGFLATILACAILLWLPFATASGQWNRPLVALFTATSAVCVTGLAVVDTGSYFSPFGQFVILVAIQIGGLGYMTATSFLLLLVGRRFSLRDHMTMEEAMGSTIGNGGMWRLVLSIVGMTLLFEGLGAFVLAQTLVADRGWVSGSWSALFHSVSAFNNAGFSLFSDSLESLSGNTAVMATISGLIILGGIGYGVILEFYHWLHRSSFERQHNKRENYSLNFKIVTTTTALLLISGMLMFLAIEVDNPATLGRLSWPDRILGAWFQSVTARTAGFNSFNQASLEASSLFLMMIFMFTGASPGGTGGGVKTTTLGTLLSCMKSALRGEESVRLFQRRVPDVLVQKAVGILMGSIVMVAIATMGLALSDGDRFTFIELVFEAVSAYATVGLSIVGTPNLSPLSHLVLIPTMYCGRVGILLLVGALLGRSSPKKLVRYPEETFLIG
ncbi:MAG: TrkH family potassium uptake protein [Cyanobacteria bacterium P01_D01_bin.123]